MDSTMWSAVIGVSALVIIGTIGFLIKSKFREFENALQVLHDRIDRKERDFVDRVRDIISPIKEKVDKISDDMEVVKITEERVNTINEEGTKFHRDRIMNNKREQES